MNCVASAKTAARSTCNAPFSILPDGDSFDIFPAIHQGKKSAEDARFRFVRQSGAARRQARQLCAVLDDVIPHFTEALARARAHRRLPPHLHARLLELEREMQDAPPLRFKLLRDPHLAANDFAIHIHGILRLSGRR